MQRCGAKFKHSSGELLSCKLPKGHQGHHWANGVRWTQGGKKVG